MQDTHEQVKNILMQRGYTGQYISHDIAMTCYDTSQYLGVDVGSIAKSMLIRHNTRPIMLVMAGDARIDNAKFKAQFSFRPTFMSSDDVELLTGFKSGGVSPFLEGDIVDIYIDNSLKKYRDLFPACGSQTSSIKISFDQLVDLSKAKAVVDVTK